MSQPGDAGVTTSQRHALEGLLEAVDEAGGRVEWMVSAKDAWWCAVDIDTPSVAFRSDAIGPTALAALTKALVPLRAVGVVR